MARWVWAVGGLVLLGTELFVPLDFFVIFLGVAALGVSGTVALGAVTTTTAQLLLFSVLAVLTTLGLRAPLVARLRRAQDTGVGIETLIGEVAILSGPLAPGAHTFSADAGLNAQVNAPVMNIVEKVSAFKLQTRALQDLQSGDVTGATQKLQSAVTRLLSQGEVELAQTMQQEITNLQETGQISSEGQKTMKFGTRKTVRLSDLDVPADVKVKTGE